MLARLPRAPPKLASKLASAVVLQESPTEATARQGYENLERETGIEPATLSLGRESQPEEDQ